MLADCLNSHCSGEVPGSPGVGGFDVVAPVPLHPSRYRKRGFNQAELIALALSDRSGWPMDAGCLRRVKRTHSQTTLDLQHRADNMKGAFRAAPERVAGRHVLIVDDVTTTTATLQECAAVVMEAGAACVWVAAVARTP